MVASKEDIKRFFKRFNKNIHSHMLVVCDTYDYDDYPVFVLKTENVLKLIGKYNEKSMQKVIEVYSGDIDFEKQLHEERSWNV
jgi:hypothetical protein